MNCSPVEMNETPMVDLFAEAKKIADANHSLYDGSSACRKKLLCFLEDELPYIPSKRVPTIYNVSVPMMQTVASRLQIWLKAFGHTHEEKAEILIAHFRSTYPRICKMYDDFLKSMNQGVIRLPSFPSNWKVTLSPCCWQALDYLLYVVAHDPHTPEEESDSRGDISLREDGFPWSESQRISILENGYTLLPTRTCLFLAYFLEWSVDRKTQQNRESLEVYTATRPWVPRYTYMTLSRKGQGYNNDAYSMENYMTMVYLVFSDEAVDAQHLKEKAASDRSFADLWLFIAISLISSIRATDIQRLPVPPLAMTGAALRQYILDGHFSIEEQQKLVNVWLSMVEEFMGPPSKTCRVGHVPDVVLTIPTSIRPIFATILALSMSWHDVTDTNAPFLMPFRAAPSTLRKHFGNEFAKACGDHRFSPRRAAKAYLQGLELADYENGGSRVHGYILAAIARSHKGGIGSLPSTTMIYLRDACFTGYKPEFIAFEMFERGVFGFLPSLMLERYNRELWHALDVDTQTQVIQSIGVSATQIERISTSVVNALSRAETACKEIFESGVTLAGIGQGLHNLATGCTPANQPEFMCMRIACGLPCNQPMRSCCLGCGNEVYTRATIHYLTNEYVQLQQRLRECDVCDLSRLTALSKHVVTAMQCIVVTMEQKYAGEGTNTLRELIQRRLADAEF